LSRGLLAPEEAESTGKNRTPGFRKRLGELCGWLSERYPWSEDEAARFVLTGEPPEVAPLFGHIRLSGSEESSLFSYGTITLTVEPWVSADSVKRFYREMQSKVLARKPHKRRPRSLAIFRFVVEQCKWGRERELIGKPTWPKLLELWNERYPEGHEWHYKGVWQNFQRDFGRVASVVPFPITYEAFERLRSSDSREIPAPLDDTNSH
jgi:hypothetical protein